MPDTKTVAEKLVGFSLSDKVDELRGKYHLKRKDCEAYRESSQAELLGNDSIIQLMRHNNRVRRIILAEDENGDERVIKTVFQDEREEKLALQRYTASQAIEEMDQKACEAAKSLNAMRYDREKSERKLTELGQELERMRHLENLSPEQMENHENVTQLENSLDKALIKYDTARIISQRYKQILERLKEESLTLPARLDTMEQSLLQQCHELRELKSMCTQAVQARDTAKQQTQQVEQESYEARRQREAELIALRKEVERRQKGDTERLAEKDKRSFRAALLLDQQEHKAIQESQKKLEGQHQILTYESAMQRIKQATHVTDIEDVVSRVMSQSDIGEKLQADVSSLESMRNRQRDELFKLRRAYHDMKYSGDLKLAKGSRLLEESAEFVVNEQRRFEKATEALERNGKLLADVKVGVTTLMEKLTSVKLKPPQFSYTNTGDIFDEMALCKNKVKQLMQDVTALSTGQHDLNTEICQPEFQDFLETQLPTDNVRVCLQSSSSDMSEFDYDAQDNEVMGRSDIKNQSQKLIDSREKKTKKRKAKKKQ